MVPICSVEVAILRHSWYKVCSFSFEAISRKTSPEIYGSFPFEHRNESAIWLPQFFVSFRRPKKRPGSFFCQIQIFRLGAPQFLCVESCPWLKARFCHTQAHGIHSAVQPPVGAGKLGVSASQGKRVCGPQAQWGRGTSWRGKNVLLHPPWNSTWIPDTQKYHMLTFSGSTKNLCAVTIEKWNHPLGLKDT